jgi:hypothetical protein
MIKHEINKDDGWRRCGFCRQIMIGILKISGKDAPRTICADCEKKNA